MSTSPLTLGYTTLLVNNAVGTGVSASVIFTFPKSCATSLIVQAIITGSIATATFSLDVNLGGGQWNSLAIWDAIAHPLDTLPLASGACHRLNCLTFSGTGTITVLGGITNIQSTDVISGGGSGGGGLVQIQDSSGDTLSSNGSGALQVAVISGGGSNASIGITGATAPTSATEIGIIDNSGHLQGASATNPVRIDPTGTTVQPISASALPLPSNAAQETGGNLAAAKSDLDTIAGAVTSSKVQVNVTNTSVPVTGTFFQSVQPVSLPTCVPNVQQALTTTAQIKSSAGTFWGFDWYNPNTSPVYVFVYNQTSAPTPGSSSNLIYQKALPAGAGSNEDFTIGKACSAGIYIAVSTLPSGNTAPSTGLVLTTSYV